MGNAASTSPDQLKALARVPASDVKRQGWRGIMRRLHTDGTVLITNHDQPEAVILATSAYAALLERAQQGEARIETDLAHLRRRFDERMAALEKPDAGERLRSIMRGPTTLRGKVKAGTTY